MTSSLRVNSFPIILWFMGQLGGLDQIFDESLFSLIGESIISIIVESNLPVKIKLGGLFCRCVSMA